MEWNGKDVNPRFHRFGVKDGWELDQAGNRVKVKRHIMSQWLQSEPRGERMHLSDRFRVMLGVGAVRHFRGEYERFENLDKGFHAQQYGSLPPGSLPPFNF